MNRIVACAVGVCLVLGVGVVDAQDHWTEGPVWSCASYRTLPDQFDTYMKWIRESYLQMMEEGKEQGLIVDHKVFVKGLADPEDWDVLFCTLFPSYGAAMDFDADVEAKWDALAEKIYGTGEDEEQMEFVKPRLKMREFVGFKNFREVTLKPVE
jgi:hypothetical protein